ncbi:NIF family HAD-type phosphatase [uncultured Mailhella sp.]|uniref:NIF family HAD-type phosphatase n=1 Tax=uncultured Mailhella sp. TaxID=1981031 RepID=UPI0026133A95|nr:NIF family HAD-type phosphatase [uncultured Mailhella sp.]
MLSPLPKTWILDLDGTLVKHNGYKLDGHDTLLSGAKEFLANIRPDDMVVILTSRTERYRQLTLDFLKEQNIRYDHIIFNVPYGERIVVNDKKPSGLEMALAISTMRDTAPMVNIVRDENR